MSDKDYQKMAQDFLEMWQGQTRSMAQDKRFMYAMLEMLQGKNSASSAHPFGAMSHLFDPANYSSFYQETNHADSSPSHAYAADALHAELAALHERIAHCEARIATLESERASADKTVSRRSRIQGTGSARRAGARSAARGAKRDTAKPDS